MTRRKTIRLSGGETVEERARRLAQVARAAFSPGNGVWRGNDLRALVTEWFEAGYLAASDDLCTCTCDKPKRRAGR